jgi:hypothetical protein
MLPSGVRLRWFCRSSSQTGTWRRRAWERGIPHRVRIAAMRILFTFALLAQLVSAQGRDAGAGHYAADA